MKINKIIKTILFVILFWMIGMTISNASYNASNPTVESGGKVSITVTSSTALEAYNLDLKDAGGLTFNSCSKSKGEDFVSIEGSSIGFMSISGTTKTLGTYTFIAPTVSEKKTYTVKFMVDKETIVSSTVTVNPKSNNTGNNTGNNTTKVEPKITKLVVAGKKYNNPKTSLAVDVKNDVSTAKIAVTTNTGSYKIDKGSSVKLEEGSNIVKITLDSGKVYTVNIRRAAKEEDKPNVIEEEPQEEVKVILKSLSVKGVTAEEEKIDLLLTPEFSAEVYEYKINLEEELVSVLDITKLDIQAIAAQEDFTVEIAGNEELKEGENTVTITVKSKDGNTTATYKIMVTKGKKTVEAVAPVEEEKQEEIKPIWNRTQKILITIFTSMIAMMGIAFAIIEYRYQKNHPKDETKIPYAGINVEREEDKVGEIPFAKVGFENEEDNKVDILKEESETQKDEIEEKQTKSRRGKHF